MYTKDLVQIHAGPVLAALVSVSSYEFCSCWFRGPYVFFSFMSSMPSGSSSLFAFSSTEFPGLFYSYFLVDTLLERIIWESSFPHALFISMYMDQWMLISINVTIIVELSCSQLPLAQFSFILSSKSESHYFLLTTIGCGVISKLNHVEWILIFLLVSNLKL